MAKFDSIECISPAIKRTKIPNASTEWSDGAFYDSDLFIFAILLCSKIELDARRNGYPTKFIQVIKVLSEEILLTTLLWQAQICIRNVPFITLGNSLNKLKRMVLNELHSKSIENMAMPFMNWLSIWSLAIHYAKQPPGMKMSSESRAILFQHVHNLN